MGLQDLVVCCLAGGGNASTGSIVFRHGHYLRWCMNVQPPVHSTNEFQTPFSRRHPRPLKRSSAWPRESSLSPVSDYAVLDIKHTRTKPSGCHWQRPTHPFHRPRNFLDGALPLGLGNPAPPHVLNAPPTPPRRILLGTRGNDWSVFSTTKLAKKLRTTAWSGAAPAARPEAELAEGTPFSVNK